MTMAAVHLAPSLVRARNAINRRWPRRDHASDGWIGDAAHQATVSDHNPNSRGSVDALDVDTHGGTTPVHIPSIIAGFILHPATNYVICNRRIFQRSDRFRPRTYNGPNPHTSHCHESIRQTVAAEQDQHPWPIFASFPSWTTMRKGATGTHVKELQAFLNGHGGSLVVDGDFGTATDAAVRAFQRREGIGVDGIVGPVTRGKLFS